MYCRLHEISRKIILIEDWHPLKDLKPQSSSTQKTLLLVPAVSQFSLCQGHSDKGVIPFLVVPLVSLMSDRFEYSKQSLLNEWGMSSGRGKPGRGHSCFPVLAWGGVTLDKETADRV